MDFFNEISLIWGIICDIGVASVAVGSGFPPGFEYRWSDGSKIKAPVNCSGPQYVEYVMNWVDKEINNDVLFPTSAGNNFFIGFNFLFIFHCDFFSILATPFPKNFMASIKVIYTRLFRIFAIIYCHHFLQLEELGAVSHLNTSFKHFIFFTWEFDLVQTAEQEALQDIIEELKLRHVSAFTSSTNNQPGLTLTCLDMNEESEYGNDNEDDYDK